MGEPELTFQSELQSLLNRYSKENESDTPDFLLAIYLEGCLSVYSSAIDAREVWHGRRSGGPLEVGGVEKA